MCSLLKLAYFIPYKKKKRGVYIKSKREKHTDLKLYLMDQIINNQALYKYVYIYKSYLAISN